MQSTKQRINFRFLCLFQYGTPLGFVSYLSVRAGVASETFARFHVRTEYVHTPTADLGMRVRLCILCQVLSESGQDRTGDKLL